MSPRALLRPARVRALLPVLLPALAFAPALAACAAPTACRPATIDSLSLRTVEGNPVVTVSVDGTPVSMLLDTGADTSAITRAAALRLHLAARPDGRTTVTGLDGTHAPDVVRTTLALSGRGRVLTIPVVDLPGNLGDVAGFAGMDILSDYDLDLDQPGHLLTLRRSAGCSPDQPPPWPGRAIRLPATFTARQRVLVTVGVFWGTSAPGGGTGVQALLDTGSAGSVLSRNAARRAGLTDAALAGGTPFTYYGAALQPLQVSTVRLDRLQVGSESLPGQEVAVPQADLPGVDMLLGNDYLARRRVLVSWARRTVFVGAPAAP